MPDLHDELRLCVFVRSDVAECIVSELGDSRGLCSKNIRMTSKVGYK